jgi:hypothetical protein
MTQKHRAAIDAMNAAAEALSRPFCVVFLDGRNEHGSHVLTSFPKSFDDDAGDIYGQSEAILLAAEAAGFAVGDHVWAEFDWISPQIGDEGRVELPGYWEFRSINNEMTIALAARSNSTGGQR